MNLLGRYRALSKGVGQMAARVSGRGSKKDVEGEPKRKPHLARDAFERTVGGISAAVRVPVNVVSGLVVGGVQGYRKGGSEPVELGATGTAVGQVTVNTMVGQAWAAVTGLLAGGPIGMMIGMAYDAVNAIPGIYICVKNGSAKKIGGELSKAIEEKVEPGQGRLRGMAQGLATGTATSFTAAAATGYQEGKGTAGGLIDGVESGAKVLKSGQKVKGNLFSKPLRAGLGVALGLLSLPAGIVTALNSQSSSEKAQSKALRLGISAASGLAIGTAVGSFAGPVGMGVGAGLGAVLGLLGPSAKQGFHHSVNSHVDTALEEADDFDTKVADNNRNLFLKTIVGGASAVHQGWNLTAG